MKTACLNHVLNDVYPSRVDETGGIYKRKDPVIYSNSLSNSPLSQQQIQDYEKNGFLIIENVFSTKEINTLKTELDKLRKDESICQSNEIISEPQSRDIRSIFRVHEKNKKFGWLACNERLAKIAQYILNDEVYIHQSRLNYKPAFRGKEFYWHSDFETWHVEDGMPRMRALSISIPLTPNKDTNGPLLLIPGSHKHFVACRTGTPDDHFKQSLKQQEYGIPTDTQLRSLTEETEVKVASPPPGSIIIFDCNIMHGSNGNITPYPRSNAFFVYNALSNKVQRPFSLLKARPEFLCARQNIVPISEDEINETFYE